MDIKTSTKKSNICAFDGCKKKLDIVSCITNKCNCEKTFCSTHRPSSVHSCTFDYKSACSKRLESTLPKIVGSKLESF